MLKELTCRLVVEGSMKGLVQVCVVSKSWVVLPEIKVDDKGIDQRCVSTCV